MAVSVRVQPIDRDLIIRLTGTPQDRSRMFANFARDKLAEAEQVNQTVLGHIPPHKTFVDGTLGASEDNVRPDGVIVYEFEIISDALIWIGEQLQSHSPVGSGRDPHPGLYQASHVLFADGEQVDPGADAPIAQEYVFINSQPYARKIENGLSAHFPDGVYQSVATMASARFGNIAKITFGFRPMSGGAIGSWASSESALAHARRHKRRASNAQSWLTRQPAIVVTPR